MEHLTIGAAIPGLISISSKISRLLKAFISSPNAPESMTTILAHVTSISTALKTLKSILDDLQIVPTEIQEAIQLTNIVVPLTGSVFVFSSLEKSIDRARRDLHVPLRATNFVDGTPLRGYWDADCLRDDVAFEDVLWAVENTDEYPENWNSEMDEEGDDGSRGPREKIAFDQDSWNESSEAFLSLLGCLEVQKRMFEALVMTSQRTMLGHLVDQTINLSNLTGETFNQNARLPGCEQEMEELSRWFEELPASLCTERLKFGYQCYVDGRQLSTQSRSGSLAQPTNADDVNAKVLPITSKNANRSWYHILPPSASPSPPTSFSSEFTISIKNLTGAVTSYKISSETTCLDLKRVMERNDGLRLEQQYLVFEPDNRWLPESVVLSDRCVREGTRIHILLPFWGRGRS